MKGSTFRDSRNARRVHFGPLIAGVVKLDFRMDMRIY